MSSIRGKTILDLGCGTGVLIQHVIHQNGYYIGIDNSENMLEFIQKKYPKMIKENKVKLFFQDIRDFDVPRKVDIAVGLGFIEYFEEPEKMVKILNEFILPGGQLILSFPNFNSLDYLGVRIFAPFRFLARKISGKYTNQPPRKLWNNKTAKQLFLNAGYKNLRIVNYNINLFAYPFTKISMGFTNLWARKLEYSKLSAICFFASGFIISAEKPK